MLFYNDNVEYLLLGNLNLRREYYVKKYDKNKNIIIPFVPYNDSDFIQRGGVLIWSGWAFIWPSASDHDSWVKQMYRNFNFIAMEN